MIYIWVNVIANRYNDLFGYGGTVDVPCEAPHDSTRRRDGGGMCLTLGTPVSHFPPQSGLSNTEIESSGASRWEESATATRMKSTGAKKRIIGSVALLVGMTLGIVAHHKDRKFSRS